MIVAIGIKHGAEKVQLKILGYFVVSPSSSRKSLENWNDQYGFYARNTKPCPRNRCPIHLLQALQSLFGFVFGLAQGGTSELTLRLFAPIGETHVRESFPIHVL